VVDAGKTNVFGGLASTLTGPSTQRRPKNGPVGEDGAGTVLINNISGAVV
jgi:hypothetical protein